MAKRNALPSAREIERMIEANRAEWEALRKKQAQRARQDSVRRAPRVPRGIDVRPKPEHSFKPEQAPIIKGISRTRAPRQPLDDSSVVKLTKGTTRIKPGSLRAQVLAELKREYSMSIRALQQAMAFDVKPVIVKLRDAGWVEVM